MNPTYDFSGQVALVTGASPGIGLAAAQAFADAAAAVVGAYVNESAHRNYPCRRPHPCHRSTAIQALTLGRSRFEYTTPR